VKGSEEAKERMQRVRSSTQRTQQPQQQQPQQQQPQPQQPQTQQPQRRMNKNTTSRMSSLNNALQSSHMPSVYQNPLWFQNS